VKHTAQQITIQKALHPDQQYTNVTTIGNKVYVRARKNDGAPVFVESKYTPAYYMPVGAGVPPTHVGYDGTPLVVKLFPNLYDARQFIDGSPIKPYGDIQAEYMLLSDVYGAKDVGFDMDRLYIWDVDIEVDSEDGFAKPDDPFAEVTAITVMWRHMGKSGTVVYGRKPYTPVGDEFYRQCATEEEMLLTFLDDLRAGGDYPDILTGWNVQFYDFPYLVKRLQQLFTEDTWEKISPFNRLAERKVILLGRSQTVVDIKGIAILDYQELYRKFTYSQQASYRLDHIAHVELKDKKVSYKEYQTLRRLYSENPQLFIEYNIQDVKIVDRLDQKLKLIELVCALAYGAKANFVDCFKQVRLWDIMIYHKLRADGKQIPPRKDASKGEQYAGAYVKEPRPGLYKWVCSFDVASMYPHIIREWNLSPESKYPDHVGGLMTVGLDGKNTPSDALVAREIDTSSLVARDECMASNGVLTRRDREGFLPEMLKTLYDERIRFKKLQKAAEAAKEHETDPVKIAELVKNISAYENQQKVRKVNLNSAYGAMGSAYFRFYDVALAEAVTVTGQMIIRSVANDINAYLNTAFKDTRDYIIASDTDSVYIDMTRLVEMMQTAVYREVTKEEIVNRLDGFCKLKIQPLINKCFDDLAAYYNVALPCLSMVRDVIADNCIWTGKKHYIMNVFDSEGVRYETPKLKVLGLEMVKSSTPQIVRDMMKKALTMLVSGQTQQDMWDYLKACEDTFCAAPFEDIGKPSSVNGLAKYAHHDKSIPFHVRGALCFNDTLTRMKMTDRYELIREGEKIMSVYLREPNPFHSNVMCAAHGCPPEWKIEQWIDYDTQLAKVFLDPLNSILECANWTLKKEVSLWD
jgi:DNA polymerase elongation subunit (family B)